MAFKNQTSSVSYILHIHTSSQLKGTRIYRSVETHPIKLYKPLPWSDHFIQERHPEDIDKMTQQHDLETIPLLLESLKGICINDNEKDLNAMI